VAVGQNTVAGVLPLPASGPKAAAAAAPVFVELSEELKERSAYKTLRQERTNARLAGRRAKKAKEAAEKKEGEEKKADAAGDAE
jgi:hypothetical protein